MRRHQFPAVPGFEAIVGPLEFPGNDPEFKFNDFHHASVQPMISLVMARRSFVEISHVTMMDSIRLIFRHQNPTYRVQRRDCPLHQSQW